MKLPGAATSTHDPQFENVARAFEFVGGADGQDVVARGGIRARCVAVVAGRGDADRSREDGLSTSDWKNSGTPGSPGPPRLREITEAPLIHGIGERAGQRLGGDPAVLGPP